MSTRLAIFAALELAAGDERQLSVAEIGKKYGVSSHHLAKVLNAMGRAGLVHSVRGAGGGYRLARNTRRLTVLDVVQVFENLGAMESDTVADRTAEGRALRELLSEIDEITQATLGSVTIATMRKNVERRRPARRRAG
jgi:Rrf2 family protein